MNRTKSIATRGMFGTSKSIATFGYFDFEIEIQSVLFSGIAIRLLALQDASIWLSSVLQDSAGRLTAFWDASIRLVSLENTLVRSTGVEDCEIRLITNAEDVEL